MAEIEILQNMITDHLIRVSSLARDDPERIALQNEIEDTIRQSVPGSFDSFPPISTELLMALTKSERHALGRSRIQKFCEACNHISSLIYRSRGGREMNDDDDDEDENGDENEDDVEDDDEDVVVEETAN